MTEIKPQKKKEDIIVHRSSLKLSRISPLSVFGVSIAFAFVMGVAIWVLFGGVWYAFDHWGIFNKVATTFTGNSGAGREKLESWLSLKTFLTLGGVFAATVAFIIPAFTLFSVGLYNVISKITGGVRVELSERANIEEKVIEATEESPTA